MICVRPRLKLNGSIFNSNENKFAIRSQCPSEWMTSSLIAERNRCYRVFKGVDLQFDEADKECQKHDGQLAVASNPSALAVLLNIFPIAELVQVSNLWIGLKRNKNGFEWMDKSNWTYQNKIEWADGLEDASNIYGVSLSFLIESHNNIYNSVTMQWKRWPKDANVTGYICQKKIFPQPQVALHITLNTNYQPVVSMQPVQSHFKDLNVTNPHIAEPFILSKLTCFLSGNSTFSTKYQSNNVTINFEMIVVPKSRWRSAEISCETWDTWSPESLQASWIMKRVETPSENVTTIIVWFRHHQTETYVPEKHDETFITSANQRELFKKTIESVLFSRNSSNFNYVVFSAYDPITFEPESNDGHFRSLLIKYRIVGIQRNWSLHSVKPDTFSIMDLQNKITSQLHSSSNKSDFEFIGVRSPDFCPSEITRNDGEFIQFDYNMISECMKFTDPLCWPQSVAGSLVTPVTRCATQSGHFLRRRCLGDQSSGLYLEPIENKVCPFFCVQINHPKILSFTKLTMKKILF